MPFKAKAMKRKGNLFKDVISLENLRLADAKAQKGKSKQFGVQAHNKNREANILNIRKMLMNKTYKTSEYDIFKVYEPKEREVYKLPYFPDRITHHAIMNVLEPIFVSTFTQDSYSCIKGKGIHAASTALTQVLKNDMSGTIYCLKLDVKKFYPNIDHDILKELLKKKIKDNDVHWLLNEIIDSAAGLPIGNYLSQFFANFYLTYFDHWLKEVIKVKYYFRYADDMVILSKSKPYLHALLTMIKSHLNDKLKLQVKDNYQVFPVADRGIDFVGYVHYHTHKLLRKSIKKRMAKAAKSNNPQIMAAYYGWAKHCNSINLLNKLNMKKFKDLGISKPAINSMTGDKIKIERILNKEVKVLKYSLSESKFKGSLLTLQIEYKDEKHVIFTGSSGLIDQIKQVSITDFPFTTTIVKESEYYEFN